MLLFIGFVRPDDITAEGDQADCEQYDGSKLQTRVAFGSSRSRFDQRFDARANPENNYRGKVLGNARTFAVRIETLRASLLENALAKCQPQARGEKQIILLQAR